MQSQVAMAYLLVSFPLRTSAALFSSIAPAFRQEVELPAMPIRGATYHNSLRGNVKNGNTGTQHKVFGGELSDEGGKGRMGRVGRHLREFTVVDFSDSERKVGGKPHFKGLIT